MADNRRYSNWRRRHEAWQASQDAKKAAQLKKDISRDSFEHETRTANNEVTTGNSWLKSSVLEAYKIALKAAYGQSQCNDKFVLLSFGCHLLFHEPAISSFVLEEFDVEPVNSDGSDKYGWVTHEVSMCPEYFPYGDGYSEFLPIELALLDAMIAYLNRGGALSQYARGPILTSNQLHWEILGLYQ